MVLLLTQFILFDHLSDVGVLPQERGHQAVLPAPRHQHHPKRPVQLRGCACRDVVLPLQIRRLQPGQRPQRQEVSAIDHR